MNQELQIASGTWCAGLTPKKAYEVFQKETLKRVAQCSASGGRFTLEQEANARLIAEAGTVANETGLMPREMADQRVELLECLEGLVRIVEGIRYSNLLEKNQEERFDRAKAATAKARGRS